MQGSGSSLSTTAQGSFTETQALHWLQAEQKRRNVSWDVWDRNFRCREGELDLVGVEELASGVRTLVVVEVRGRSTQGWVDGLESVTWPKRQRVERAIRRYLVRRAKRLVGVRDVRIDVLSWNEGGWLWVKGAWSEGE